MDFDADATHPTTSLGVYALGMLGADEEHAVRRHLEECAGCRVEVDDLEGMAELLAAARLVPEPSESVADSVLADLPQRDRGPALVDDPRLDPGPGEHAGARGRRTSTPAGLDVTSAVEFADQPAVAGSGTPQIDAGGGTPAIAEHGDDRDGLIMRPVGSRWSPRSRRPTLKYVLALGIGVLAALVFVWIYAAISADAALTASLTATGGAGADGTGTVAATQTENGLELDLDIAGLDPGAYEVSVDAGSKRASAGTFRTDDAGDARVAMTADVDADVDAGGDAATVTIVSAADDRGTVMSGELNAG